MAGKSLGTFEKQKEHFFFHAKNEIILNKLTFQLFST